MSKYKKPCPNPMKGEQCHLCGGTFLCLQPERPKIAAPKPPPPPLPKEPA